MNFKYLFTALFIAFLVSGATCQKKEKNASDQNEDTSSQVDSDSADDADY